MKTIIHLLLLVFITLATACQPQLTPAATATATPTSAPTHSPTATPAPATPTQIPATPEPMIKLQGEKMSLEVVGITVIPHTFSGTILQIGEPDPVNGALVQVFVRNSAKNGSTEAVAPAEAYFNGKSAMTLLHTGTWTWSDTPAQRPDAFWRIIPARMMDVYTFNVRDPQFWGDGGTFSMRLLDPISKIDENYVIPISQPGLMVTKIEFGASLGNELAPDEVTLHIRNGSAGNWQVTSVSFWAPTQELAAQHAWQAHPSKTEITPFGRINIIPAGTQGGVTVKLETPLPLAPVIVEVQVTDGNETRSLFNTVRADLTSFEIGAGALNASENKEIPLKKEPFLKLIRSLHISTAHVGIVSGYTDKELYEKYPLKLFSALNDNFAKYSSKEWVPRIHAADKLGDVQCPTCATFMQPQPVFETLREYEHGATYPVALALSDEPAFRYYAGLSDLPILTAQTASAPSAYTERWGGQVIDWIAPLELTGEMIRTLNAVSMPKPVAAWVQTARPESSSSPLEIRIRAFEALANGITSLYWDSLENKALICHSDTITELQREGREMMMLASLLGRAAPAWNERQTDRGIPTLDLAVLNGPDFSLMFAIDLTYRPDLTQKRMVSDGPREIEASYPLPYYLTGELAVFKLDAEGVHDIEFNIENDKINIKDKIDITGVYIVTQNAVLRKQMENKFAALLEVEKSYNFAPATDEEDFSALFKALGYKNLETCKK